MDYCKSAPGHPWHGPYHDNEYGFPIRDDAALLERLTLEINQAGLSWLLVLKKREAFHRAFEGFDPETVAAYGDAERERLLADASIIRNRRKVDAVIANARQILDLRESNGSFVDWIEEQHPKPKAEWVKLFRDTFSFMGPEVVGEFLMSIGYLPGAHQPDCPVYERIRELEPAWARVAA